MRTIGRGASSSAVAPPVLAGKRLVCHCKASAPCHADVLIRVSQDMLNDSGAIEATILAGIFYSKGDFVAAALVCEHPFTACA